MTHRFTDALTLDGTHKRRDGYLVADAKVARTGIQIYSGTEVGRPDLKTVRVYRAEDQVFSKASMASFANIPVTNDHPPEVVTADNWAKYAKGQTGEDVARDGEALRIPLMIADGATIADIEAGKRELSNGYMCDLNWDGGTTPSGEEYDAEQINIIGNHVAVVQAGRAGSEFRIGDGANDGGKERNSWGPSPITHADEKETSMSTLQTVVLGDKAVKVDPSDVAIIDAFKADTAQALADSNTAHKTALDAKDTELAAKDSEIEELKAKVLDDAAIDALVDTKAKLVADAKLIAPDVKTEGLSLGDIRKAVVSDKIGADKIADKSDAYIDARFDGLLETAVADANKADPFADALKSGIKVTGDAKLTAHQEMMNDKANAWKGKA